MTFQTSEQGFMYSKALLFGDHEIAKKILNAKTPKEAKAYGRKVRNFDEVVWKQQRIILMTNNLYAKFSQNQHLKLRNSLCKRLEMLIMTLSINMKFFSKK